MSLGANKQALMGAAGASGAGGDFYSYQITNSVRMSKSANSTLKITAGTASSEKTFTYSWWWKRYNVTDTATNSTLVFCAGTGGGTYVFFTFTNSSEQNSNFNFTGGGYGDTRLITDMQFRDTASWYHCVLRCDSTQSSASDRIRFYVNGTETSYSSITVQGAISQDEDFSFMNESGVVQSWGGISGVGTGAEGVDVQLADVILCDGQSYAPTEFGETKNGAWIPKDPSGLTFGNNGYYLKFTNSSDLGEDFSGNNNDLTVANISAHDQMLDTPTFNSDTNGGNFCTMNPLSIGSAPALAEGNLMMDSFSGSDISGALATFALPPSSGKWYFECFINSPNSGDNYPFIGLTATTHGQSSTYGVSQRDLSINLGTGGATNSSTYVGTITTDFTGVSNYADNTICGVFVDMDNRKLWYAKDGAFTNSGNPQTGANPNYTWTNDVPLIPHFVSFSSYGADSVLNFGQEGTFAGNVTAGGNADVTGYGNFKYDPGDYKALCAGNLPLADEINPAETSDDYPQKLFNPILYTGNGSTQSVTGLGFQPDLTWIKNRNSTQGNKLFDSSRGVTKMLASNNTDTETTESGLSAFDSDGFSFGGSTVAGYNTSTNTYVAWNWRTNGGTTSSETAGSINTTVQVNQNAGFSIVQYVGDGGSSNCTMVHGLGKKPAFVLLKDRDSNGNNNQWQAWHHKLDTNGYFYLSSNDQAYTSTNGTVNAANNTTNLIEWNRTSTTGGAQTMSESGDNFLMYIWAEITGFSSFGRYIGNGNANGTFCHTGFRPALVTTKRIDGSGGWLVHDDARNTYNPANLILQWNDSGAEFSGSNDKIDMLSNGFKVKSSNAGINGNNNDYIYAAWAENPFKFAVAR